MAKKVIGALLVWGIAATASADPLMKTYSGLMVADWVTTFSNIQAGAVETNPLAKPFIQKGDGGRMLVGAALDTLLAIGIGRLPKKVRKPILFIGIGVRSYAVASNAISMQRN